METWPEEFQNLFRIGRAQFDRNRPNHHHASEMNLSILRHCIRAAIVFAIASYASGQDSDGFHIWHEKTRKGYQFYALNPSPFPRSLEISFPELDNLGSSTKNPFRTVLTEKSNRIPLLELRVSNPRIPHRFTYEWNYSMGDFRRAKHQDSHLYLLPFAHGTKHIVSQGYHGRFSHSDPGEEFALDFTMPVGTPVHASRAGTVIKIIQSSDRHGTDKSYEKDANLISILHDDGSIAEYLHLRKNGAVKKVGDRVSAGQIIGFSGNTGRSLGPHLHFHVAVPTSTGNIRTVPTRFLNHEGKPVSLDAGQAYYAFHPGKPRFETLLGSEISKRDFASYRRSISADQAISTREETIDGTILLFVRNGFDDPKRFRLEFENLENLDPSRPVPLGITVEPRSERFLLYLRPRDPLRPYRYKTRWSHHPVE